MRARNASGVSAGSHYVLLLIDASRAVNESSEGNNTLVKAITVRYWAPFLPVLRRQQADRS